MKFIFIFISLATTFLFCLLRADDDQQHQQEINRIDQEITGLKARLYKSQLDEFNKEIEGQEHMIANWKKYEEDVQEIKQLEDNEEQLQKQIEALEQKKMQLQTPPQLS